MIQLFRGDDSDFAGLNQIVITIDTELSLTGFTGCFCFLGVQKELSTAEIASKAATIAYTSEETSGFTLGLNYGKLTLWDAQGRKAAVTKVLVEVLAHRLCAGTPGNEITVQIENQFDYNTARNKPKINGVTLVGNKTSAELGIDKDPNAVHYTADTAKSAAEKTQARQNIEAASTADLSAHTANRENPHQVTKAQVGLGNCDNTSDLAKPVSTATAAQLAQRVKIADLKAAVKDPSTVKLSPASIKAWMKELYEAVQAL